MTTVEPRRDLDEIGRRGGEIFERVVRPTLPPLEGWKYIAIELASGDYEIDSISQQAVTRLRARHLSPEVWLMRTDGSPAFRMRSHR